MKRKQQLAGRIRTSALQPYASRLHMASTRCYFRDALIEEQQEEQTMRIRNAGAQAESIGLHSHRVKLRER